MMSLPLDVQIQSDGQVQTCTFQNFFRSLELQNTLHLNCTCFTFQTESNLESKILNGNEIRLLQPREHFRERDC